MTILMELIDILTVRELDVLLFKNGIILRDFNLELISARGDPEVYKELMQPIEGKWREIIKNDIKYEQIIY